MEIEIEMDMVHIEQTRLDMKHVRSIYYRQLSGATCLIYATCLIQASVVFYGVTRLTRLT